MVDPLDPRGIKPLPPLRNVRRGEKRERRRSEEKDEERRDDERAPGGDRRGGRHIDERC